MYTLDAFATASVLASIRNLHAVAKNHKDTWLAALERGARDSEDNHRWRGRELALHNFLERADQHSRGPSGYVTEHYLQYSRAQQQPGIDQREWWMLQGMREALQDVIAHYEPYGWRLIA